MVGLSGASCQECIWGMIGACHLSYVGRWRLTNPIMQMTKDVLQCWGHTFHHNSQKHSHHTSVWAWGALLFLWSFYSLAWCFACFMVIISMAQMAACTISTFWPLCPSNACLSCFLVTLSGNISQQSLWLSCLRYCYSHSNTQTTSHGNWCNTAKKWCTTLKIMSSDSKIKLSTRSRF